MASNPVMRKLETFVKAIGGDEWIFDMLAEGLPVKRIAARTDLPGHGPVSRSYLYRWRDKSPERVAAWAKAIRDGAHALAEDAGDYMDKLDEDPTSAQVAKAKGQYEHRKWLAAKRNKEAYGDGPAVLVNVLGAGELHLDALRQLEHMNPQLALPEGKCEVLSEERA